MLIAFHTKHIMGAQSLKAVLPLRVDFIELGRGSKVLRVCRAAGCMRAEERSCGSWSPPGGLLRLLPSRSRPESQRH
jgi:hypothetical protein